MGLKERRQREKDARRELILQAARELLHEKGLVGASMNQIAKRAELGVATLYSYFRNKEELFLTIQQEGFNLLKQKMVDAIGDDTDSARQLQTVANTYLAFSRQNKNYYYIINYFGSSPEILFEPNLKVEIDGQAAQSLQIPTKIIEEGIENGIFKKTNAKRAAIMFSGLLQGLTQYQKFEQTIFSGEHFDDLFDFSIMHFIDSLK